MTHRVDTKLLAELERFGAKDIRECFNCGNCTAICPHSEASDAFPRKLIRYAQIGHRKGLLGSKDLWVCYYCGECSDTCPREAEPGEFMAAARRYAIASYDPTGIGRLLYGSPAINLAVMVAVGAVLTWLLLRGPNDFSGPFFTAGAVEGFLSFKTVHDLGILIGLAAGFFMAVGVLNMAWSIFGAPAIGGSAGIPRQGGGLVAGIRAVVHELFTQKRYKDCATEHTKREPWYGARWLLHWSMLWGFAALLVATTWDYLFKPVEQSVPIWYPARLIGTVGAILFIYGTALSLWQRIEPESKYAKNSRFTDWVFIWILFLLAVTGILLEVLVYAAPATAIGNLILLVHVVLAFELILLLPFSKFAHVVYRTLAVFLHAYRGKEADVPVAVERRAA